MKNHNSILNDEFLEDISSFAFVYHSYFYSIKHIYTYNDDFLRFPRASITQGDGRLEAIIESLKIVISANHLNKLVDLNILLNLKIIQYLAKQRNIDICINEYGKTQLHYAYWNGHLKIVERYHCLDKYYCDLESMQ